MGVNNEDHRESPHRINIFNPLLRHYACKDTEFFSIFWFFAHLIVSLHHERKNHLD